MMVDAVEDRASQIGGRGDTDMCLMGVGSPHKVYLGCGMKIFN